MTGMVSRKNLHVSLGVSKVALDELPWAALLIDHTGIIWAANPAAHQLLRQGSRRLVQSQLEYHVTPASADSLRNALHATPGEKPATTKLSLRLDGTDSEITCLSQPLPEQHDPPLFELALLSPADPTALAAALSTATARCFEATTPAEFLGLLREAASPFGISLELALRHPVTRERVWRADAEGYASSYGTTSPSSGHLPDLRGTPAESMAGALSSEPESEGPNHSKTFFQQTCLTLPLATKDAQWGMLVASGPGLSERTRTFFQSLSELLGLAVERLHQRAGLHLDQFHTALLLKAGQAITAVTELDDVLRVICEQALNLGGGTTAFLLTPESEDEYLRCIMALGSGSELLLGQRCGLADTLAGHVFREIRERVVEDAAAELEGDVFATQLPQMRSAVMMALRVQGRTVGVLGVWHHSPGFFGPLQQRVLEQYGSAAAVALENAQLHEAMRRSEERYRTLFQNALEIVITLDIDGRIMSWNRAALQFLGLSPAELRGGVLNIRELMLPEQAALMAELQARALQGYAPVPTEIKMIRAGGALAIVEITVQMFQERGQTDGVYIIGRDMTERRQLEAQLRQGEKLAALGQLAAGAAHELNNPLAVVLGTTQLLLRDPRAAALSEDVRNIEAAAQRAKHIIKQMLTFAREHDDVRGPVELAALIERVLQGKRKQFDQYGVQVNLEFDPHPPPVWGDAYQLEQVFDNLLHNAAQALGESRRRSRHIRVAATVVGKMLRVNITDNGPGIAPHVLPRIFDPFFTTKDVGSGTGLGLSLVFGIVDKHGGSIRAESTYGHGATFVVDLPLSKVSAAKPSPTAIRGPMNCTILVVEDEFDVRMILERALAQYGYAVEAVESGEAALIKLSEQHYDLVITDMPMRGMSGRELFERVRVTQPQLNWVFITGDTMSVSSESFIKQTGVPFLPKPFSLEELWEAVAHSIVGSREPVKPA